MDALTIHPETGHDDEDVLVIPPSWGKKITVRRGGRWTSVTPDRTAATKVAERLDFAGPMISYVIDPPDTEERLSTEVRAYLGGAATPVGAAATVQLVSHGHRNLPAELGSFADVWTADHGIAFAAAAVAELAGLQLYHVGHWHLRHRPDNTWYWEGEPIVRRLRALLAQATEAEHAEAFQALLARRDRQFQRIVCSYLVPSRQDWVTELCSEVAPSSVAGVRATLLLGAVGTVDQLALLDREGRLAQILQSKETVATLADAIGPASAPFLATMLERLTQGGRYRDEAVVGHILEVVADLPTDQAFDVLVERAEQPAVLQLLLGAIRRFPRRAVRRLAAAGTGATTVGGLATRLLTNHVHAEPALAAEILPELPPAAREVLTTALARAAERVPEAQAAALPRFLVEPPWQRSGDRRKQVALTGLTPTVASAIKWAPGEHAEWADLDKIQYPCLGANTDWVDLVQRFRAGSSEYLYAEMFATGPEDLIEPLMPEVRAQRLSIICSNQWVRPLIARHGLDFLDSLLKAPRSKPAHLASLLPIVDGRVAEFMSRRLRSAADRPVAMQWFRRHPREAAGLLIPDALGRPGTQRRAAENALRVIATEVDRAEVSAAAHEYGAQAAALIETMLATDPLDVRPATAPAVGNWIEPSLLPQLLLRGRASALPIEAVRTVLSVFVLCGSDERHPGVDLVVEVCDPASLSDFVAAVLESWLALDSGAANGAWVLPALGHIGDDATVRRLVPLIRSWPGKDQKKRALAGLGALARIGSDLALLNLNQFAEKLPFPALRKRAKQKIGEAAEERGLTLDELGDRLVPDLGLSDAGTLELDYGPRRFVVGFDEALRPVVRDAQGKVRKSMPKPGPADDQERASAAHQHFAVLKKDVRSLATAQIDRLERAMVDQRRWSITDLRRFILDHPLLWQLAARLVWIVEEDDRATGTVRIAEDRTFADSADETVVPSETAKIGIAHPLEMTEELAAWSALFSDYEIMQPFPQLARGIHRLTDDERTAHTLTRFEDVSVPLGRLFSLAARGWERDEPGSAGLVTGYSRLLPDGHALRIAFEPGYRPGDRFQRPEQRLTGVGLGAHRTTPLGEINPVGVAELIYEAQRLIG